MKRRTGPAKCALGYEHGSRELPASTHMMRWMLGMQKAGISDEASPDGVRETDLVHVRTQDTVNEMVDKGPAI